MTTDSEVGRFVTTRGARVAGVVSCIPHKKVENTYFAEQFGEAATTDVVKMIGVQTRFWADPSETTSDLCHRAGIDLFDRLRWPASTVDALIFVSQTPDFRLPATACALQERLGLRSGSIAFDVNLGCSGYPYALWLGMMMVSTGSAKRVAVAVGDTVSKFVDKADRATAMLFGDAGTMTGIEAAGPQDPGSVAHFVLGTDGKGADNLIIPDGGYRLNWMRGDARMEQRDRRCLYMDGGQIFNFTLTAVPRLVSTLIGQSGVEVQEFSAFLFHQANLFMLKHLIKKTRLPAERVPINIDKFGNTSSASIPLLISSVLASKGSAARQKVAMFGFGVGYSWAAASLDLGPCPIGLVQL